MEIGDDHDLASPAAGGVFPESFSAGESDGLGHTTLHDAEQKKDQAAADDADKRERRSWVNGPCDHGGQVGAVGLFCNNTPFSAYHRNGRAGIYANVANQKDRHFDGLPGSAAPDSLGNSPKNGYIM